MGPFWGQNRAATLPLVTTFVQVRALFERLSLLGVPNKLSILEMGTSLSLSVTIAGAGSRVERVFDRGCGVARRTRVRSRVRGRASNACSIGLVHTLRLPARVCVNLLCESAV